MSVKLEIRIEGFGTLAQFLSPDNFGEALNRGYQRLVAYGETRIGIRARLDVYSYKPVDTSYRRTGRLLGGRGSAVSGGTPKKTELGKNITSLEANPTFKGAKINYAPIVNAQPFRRGAFFDNAIEEIESEGVQKMQQFIFNYLDRRQKLL